MAVPKPLILDDAGLEIGDTADPPVFAQLACVTNHLELSPDVAVTTLDTLCGSVDYPGTVKWSLVATLYQSFEAGATEDVLSAAVEGGVAVPFRITPYRSQAVSAENPQWSGTVIPQPYSPINGDAGDVSTIELEWSLVGEPIKSETPPTVMAATSIYETWTLADLQTEASNRGLATSGTKAELAARLAAYDASTPEG